MAGAKVTSALCSSLLTLAVLAGSASAVDYVWWEGEDAVQHNFNNRDFGPDTLDRPGELSNSNWLCNGGNRQGPEIFAKWRVLIAEAGAYHLYARKFWQHGPFRWRFDAGDWHEVTHVALLDNVELKKFISAIIYWNTGGWKNFLSLFPPQGLIMLLILPVPTG
jgi:hypothetical protein